MNYLNRIFFTVLFLICSLGNTEIARGTTEVVIVPPVDQQHQRLRDRVKNEYNRIENPHLNPNDLENLLQAIANEANYFIETHQIPMLTRIQQQDHLLIGRLKHKYAERLFEKLGVPYNIRLEYDYGQKWGGPFPAKVDVALEDKPNNRIYVYDYKFGEAGFSDTKKGQYRSSIIHYVSKQYGWSLNRLSIRFIEINPTN
ncbi:MAG: hypothetical protein ACTHJ4_02185 [Candidatus Nucleicultricaceae bacterium]